MENLKTDLKLNVGLLKKYSGSLKDYQNKKYVGYLYTILTLVLISFFGFFAIKPSLTTITNLQRQYEDDKIVDAALTTKLNAMSQLNAEYQSIYPYLENINNAVPSTTKAPYLFRQIENIHIKNNLNLTKIELGETEIYPSHRTSLKESSIVFNTLAEGSEQDILTFISDILSFDRLVSIESIVISPIKDSEKYNIVFSGIVYYLRNEK